MKRPTVRPSAVVAIDADDFEHAKRSEETRTFWRDVDDYEQHLCERDLDHVTADLRLR